MKRVYWRPPAIPRSALLLVALVSLVALTAVETLPIRREQPWYQQKVRAAQLARDAMNAVKLEKIRLGVPIDPEADPHGTGVIGTALSPVTSNSGELGAKTASTNPNFAAVFVDMLERAGVARGDVVAVGVSGSFPALNLSMFAALQTLELEPIVIASVSSSQFGANDPELLWIDMERLLFDKKLFAFRSVAASRGGIDDLGLGIPREGRVLIDAAIDRHGLESLEASSLAEAIDKRMRAYQEHARGRPIKAYINVGGGSASVGTHVGKKLFRPGLNLHPPRGAERVDSVMLRFGQREVPVIHVTGIVALAQRYGLDPDPKGQARIGECKVFVMEEYNRWLAAAGVLAVLAVMLAFIRMDVGMRILRGVQAKQNDARQPQQMV